MTQDNNNDDILTEIEFKVLFEKATEPPFSHPFNNHKEIGVFSCKNCQNPLFHSDYKYDSGSGWPSFFDQVNQAVVTEADHSHNMERIEIMCGHCRCHLGHVFSDGPEPTGLRYCVNGNALTFTHDF